MKKMKLFFVLLFAAASMSNAQSWEQVLPASVIQEQIDLAQPGDEVFVPAGTYQGVIKIKDGVWLRGAGDAYTVLDGQGSVEVVSLGKDTALIGFTVRNGTTLIANKGNFSGIFECTLEGQGAFAVSFQGGSGVLAHNIIRGSEGRIGVLSANANPLIVNNIIEAHQTGVQIHPHLIPSILDNLFRDNQTAIAVIGEAKAVVERNIFTGNGQNSSGLELADSNALRNGPVDDFVLERGADSASYRKLMSETHDVVVKDHPMVIYDLHDGLGSFDVIGLFPWATFTLAASTLDTRIETYHAYDIVKDQALNAEYFLEGSQRPSVRVHNPELVEKMRERYVLENRYVHAPSYYEEANGRRVFKRHTNVSQIEIVIPDGYRVVSSSPQGVLNEQYERPYLSIQDIGDTFIEVVMERVSLP